MAISNYLNVANSMIDNNQGDCAVSRDGQTGIQMQEPNKAPSAWTRFKAALSNVPLLGRMECLQQASREVSQYVNDNKALLTGLRAELSSLYGNKASELTKSIKLDESGNKPLTARQVKDMIGTAVQHAVRNNKAINDFVFAPYERYPEDGCSSGNYLADKCPELSGQWPSLFVPVQRDFAKFILENIEKYGPELTKDNLIAAANDYHEIKNWT